MYHILVGIKCFLSSTNTKVKDTGAEWINAERPHVMDIIEFDCVKIIVLAAVQYNTDRPK